MPLLPTMDNTFVVLTTAIITAISSFALGVYSVKGYLISPEFARESRANYDDPVDSDETDIDEDETVMDHAPNWANGTEADQKQGLRQRNVAAAADGKKKKKSATAKDVTSGDATPTGPTVEDTGEECKLVLVVRTDLGMTKGEQHTFFSPPRVHFCRLLISWLPHRQNRRTSLPRNTSLLQNPLPPSAQRRPLQPCRTTPVPLGTFRPGQGRGAGQVAGRASGVDGPGAEPRRYGRGDPGRRAHADRAG